VTWTVYLVNLIGWTVSKRTKFLGVVINESWLGMPMISHFMCNKLVKILVFSGVLKIKYLLLCWETYILRLLIRILNTAILFGQFNHMLLGRTKKRAVHLITYSEWNAHTAQLLHKFSILTVHQLNILHVASF